MDPLPYEIFEAMIQVFGRSFHYKDKMAAFLVGANVPEPLIEKYRNEYKFSWARKVLSELSKTEEGCIIQRRILTQLCMLKNIPDGDIQDKDAGLNAIRRLKTLAHQFQLNYIEEKTSAIDRRDLKAQELQLISQRAKKLEELRKTFNQNVTRPDRQSAGYSLENLLKDLFALFEIEYRPPYKTDTQQIDGHFQFNGFDYIVEARWRKKRPDEGEIGAFQRKVNTKLESTRGFFISVQGFRDEVVNKFNGQGANIIFMCGQDLSLILEGNVDLRDGLRTKVERAAQEGIIYYPLARMI